MKALIQCVNQASVALDENIIGRIATGMVVFIGIDADDTPATVEKMVSRLLKMRVFKDRDDKMNLSILDTQGNLLVVSQFTLSADTARGLRPGFSCAAPPERALQLFDLTVNLFRESGLYIQTGRFGAHMQVSLVNDGPMTFWLDSQK